MTERDEHPRDDVPHVYAHAGLASAAGSTGAPLDEGYADDNADDDAEDDGDGME